VVIVGGSIRGRTEVLPTSIYLEMAVGNIKHALSIALIMLLVASLVLITVRSVSGKSVFGT
jgi:molybdate transport system permease protein